MSQSQIASTRSATAPEGRMPLEKPSGTMCSPPQLGGCNSTCERPIGCPDVKKAPSCGKGGKKPKPKATPHSALGAFGGFPWLFLVAIITVETFGLRGSVASSEMAAHAGPHRPENRQGVGAEQVVIGMFGNLIRYDARESGHATLHANRYPACKPVSDER